MTDSVYHIIVDVPRGDCKALDVQYVPGHLRILWKFTPAREPEWWEYTAVLTGERVYPEKAR